MIKAFGEFVGGEIHYWPDDDRSTPLENFDDPNKVSVNLRKEMLLFDGNRGHSVEDFEDDQVQERDVQRRRDRTCHNVSAPHFDMTNRPAYYREANTTLTRQYLWYQCADIVSFDDDLDLLDHGGHYTRGDAAVSCTRRSNLGRVRWSLNALHPTSPSGHINMSICE